MVGGIYESNNTDLAMIYAHSTKSHIGRVDATVDHIIANANQQQMQQTSEYASLKDSFK